MEHIQTQNATGSSPTIELTAITADYTDLLLVYSLRSTTSGNTEFYIKLNNTNPTARMLVSAYSTSSATSNTNAYLTAPATSNTANTYGNGQIYIPNYTGTTQKSASVDNVTETNGTSFVQAMIAASLYNVTTAVTSIQVTDIYGNWTADSSISLYGIRKYNTTLAPKASGGIISYDAVNNKWVHVFTASGTFTPTENLSGVEYLVVAGGGGGGYDSGGAGGAGGYRSSVVGESSGGGASAESTLSLTASTNYTVTIGAGGNGGTSLNTRTSGSDSVFGSITATGGGRGGDGVSGGVGSSGGSGGGGGSIGSAAGGAGTTGQGYAGGAGINNDTETGGGGGAGAVGVAGVGGGIGVASSITGTSIYRAGGGGGGAVVAIRPGGQGGGGNGARNGVAVATAGEANTGGGGGGSGSSSGYLVGKNGGSGIVIVRYSA